LQNYLCGTAAKGMAQFFPFSLFIVPSLFFLQMDIRQLKYFLKVAETLNFSEASRALFITQSTLSQQIGKLEQELGIQLFERNSHEVRTTEAGEHLRQYAQCAVNSVNDCVQHIEDLKNLLTGELHIGVTFSFNSIAHEAIMAFLKKFPGVRLNVCYKPMAELLDMLKGRRLDVVLAFKPTQSDERIESRILFVNYLAAIVSETHPLARRENISLNELQNYSLALPANGLQARHALDSLAASRHLHFSANVEINNVNLLLQIVRESNYVTVLSESTILHECGLKSVRIAHADAEMEGCVHILRGSYLKQSAQEFIALLAASASIRSLYSLNYLVRRSCDAPL